MRGIKQIRDGVCYKEELQHYQRQHHTVNLTTIFSLSGHSTSQAITKQGGKAEEMTCWVDYTWGIKVSNPLKAPFKRKRGAWKIWVLAGPSQEP